jgi:hypothetical protein
MKCTHNSNYKTSWQGATGGGGGSRLRRENNMLCVTGKVCGVLYWIKNVVERGQWLSL